MTVEEAEQRVAELQREQTELIEAVRTTAQQHIDANSKLARLYAIAERQPTPANQRAAHQCEAEARALAIQAQRKEAALEACEAELAAALSFLEAARRAAIVLELEGIYAEVVGIAGALEKNLVEPALWRRLAELCQGGNALYARVRPADAYQGRTIFLDAGMVANRVLQRVEATVGAAVDLRGGRQHPVDFATVAVALDLAKVERELVHLRHIYVEGVDVPEAVAA